MKCSAKFSFFACTLHPGIVPVKQCPFRVRWKFSATSKIDIQDFKTDGHDEARVLPSVAFWNFANIFFCKGHICLKTIAPLPITCRQCRQCRPSLFHSDQSALLDSTAALKWQSWQCWWTSQYELLQLHESLEISSPDVTCRSCPLLH